jgi:hypothetical protein
MRDLGYLLQSGNLFFRLSLAETQQKTEVQEQVQALGLLSSMSTLGDTEAQRK